MFKKEFGVFLLIVNGGWIVLIVIFILDGFYV